MFVVELTELYQDNLTQKTALVELAAQVMQSMTSFK